MKTISITLGAAAFQVTPDPVASNVSELYPKSHIVGVVPVFNQKPVTATQEEWGYPYLTMTILHVLFADGNKFSCELQDVSNQAGWSGGTQADLQQAVADINAWL
jgi:hypothetical protein